MKKIIGYLKNLSRECFARDEEGNLRVLHPGDAVYEDEIVVDANGVLVHDALRTPEGELADRYDAQQNVESTLAEEKPDDKPRSHDFTYSHTSTDTFEPGPDDEVNVTAVLRTSEWLDMQGGLIRTEYANEVNVNAPLLGNIDFGEAHERNPFMPPVGGQTDVTLILDGDALVFEKGLTPDGSHAGDGSDVYTGSFTLGYAAAGINRLGVDGGTGMVNISEAQLKTAAVNPIAIDTGEGVLTINSYRVIGDSVELGYTYTLKDALSHPTGGGANRITDTITIEVEGLNTNVATGSFRVSIVDDVPIARDDRNDVTEDGDDQPDYEDGFDETTIVAGNVFGKSYASAGDVADTLGADNANRDTAVTPQTTTGKYGELILKPNGEYIYILDNTNPDVQRLSGSETLQEIFTYTIKDADGDHSSAHLDITIHAQNDHVEILIPDNDPGDGTEVVYESGLSTGSDPHHANEKSSVESRFAFKAPDTIGSPDGKVTFGTGNNNVSFTEAQLQTATSTNPLQVDTDEGILNITDYTWDSATSVGIISYRYDLKGAQTHPDADGKNSLIDTINIFVTDRDGSTAHGELDIRIVDDVPTAKPDTNAVTEDTALQATGNVIASNDVSGADVPIVVQGVAKGDTGSDSAGNVGSTLAGEYGNIVLNGDGSYTYDLNNNDVRVQHLIDGESLTETYTYTIKDDDGDTSHTTLTITIKGTDDGVTIDPVDGNAGEAPHDAGHATVYEAALDTDGSDPTSDKEKTTGTINISTKDGLGQITITDKNGNNHTIDEAALTDSANHPITIDTKYGQLEINGFTPTHNDVDGSGNLYDGSGAIEYTYTLTDNTLDHSTQGDDEVTDTIALKVEDRDGDSSTSTLNITVVDDVPSITVTTTNDAADTLTVDETDLTTDATANFANSFGHTVDAGADGQRSLVEKYTLDTTGGASGLKDTATGEDIVLSKNASGVIEGRTQTSNDLVFTLTAANNGDVTLDQKRAIVHTDPSNDDEVSATIADSLITLTKEVTVTDNDGDTATDTASIEIGSNISFKDDAPTVEVDTTTTSEPTLTVDETDLTTDVTVNFVNNFTNTTTDAGADGQKSLVEAYTLDTAGGDSGLVDVATGEAVILSKNASGVIEGRTQNSDELVFTVTASATNLGEVTLDQIRALKHGDPSNTNETVTIATDNLITLTKTTTITDNDNDARSDSASIDIASNLVFHDDAPTASTPVDATADATLDETDFPTGTSDQDDATISATTISGLFSTSSGQPLYGADGAGTVTYSLHAPNTGTGLYLVTDSTHSTEIQLTERTNNAGDIIGYDGEAGATKAFSVDIDTTTGEVSIVQYKALSHSDTTDPDDILKLDNDIFVVQKVTDRDGDSATATSQHALDITFKDDGPSVQIDVSGTNEPIITVDETDLTADKTEDFSSNFTDTKVETGADGGTVTTTYSLGVSTDNVDSGLVDTGTGEAVLLSMNGNVLEGKTSVGTIVFTLTVTNDGKVTLDQKRAIVHSNTNDNNEPSTVIDDSYITLTKEVSITDNDGDQASDSATINIGSNISFLDDGPIAVNDGSQSIEEGQDNDNDGNIDELTGNVVSNDTKGADGAVLHSFTYNKTTANGGGTETLVFDASNTTYTKDTPTGSLTVNQDGTWSFTPVASYDHDDDPNGVGNENNDAYGGSFKYTLIDGDGDISNEAEMKIDVTDTVATVTPVQATIYEAGIPNLGSDSSQPYSVSDGDLGISVGQDPISDVKFNSTLINKDSVLKNTKSGGESLVYTITDSGHTLTATRQTGGETVFVMTIVPDSNNHYTENSTYDFTLSLPFDNNGDYRNMTIPFQVVESDDTIDAENFVQVRDDVPTAKDDTLQSIIEGQDNDNDGNIDTLTGDVLANDTPGADRPASIRDFTYTNKITGQATTVDLTDGADHTVDTPTGTLTVNQDGTWSFTPVASFDHDDNLSGDGAESATNGSFTYTLKDFDGDTSTGVQTIDVTDGAAPTIDNANNTLVKVYEGDTTSIFDGTNNYQESNSDKDKTHTSTITHKLDFTKGSDNAGISEVTWEGQTMTLVDAQGNIIHNSVTITDPDTAGNDDGKGTLTVYYDGTWEYTPPSSYVHPSPPVNPGWDINNFQTTFTYKVHDIDNDEATGGSQTIQVDDTIATITAHTDAELREEHLPTGTDPDSNETTKTGTITVDDSKLGGSYDITFDTTQSDSTWSGSDGTNTPGLSSNGKLVEYLVENSGHTLRAVTDKGTANEETIFEVTLTDPTGPTPGYTTTLYHDLDHETALLENGNLEFDFNITLTDDDGDKSPSTFKVSIVDDSTIPATDTMVVDEEHATGAHDTSAIINTNANATDQNTSITGQGTYGYAEILPNGQLKYTPSLKDDGSGNLISTATNYSGTDTVQYTYVDANGNSHVTDVTVTIDPVSDAPTLTVDSATVQTNEDTDVALGLNAPQLVDTTDQNGNDAGDWPERLGAVTLEGIPNGAKLLDSSGNTLSTSTGSAITILISDLPHVNGTTADLTMTKDDFEALRVDPVAQSGDNFTVTMKSTSYEVDSNGDVINDHNGNPVAGAESTAQVVVDVQAVTDSLPDLTKVKDAHGDEDGWIRVDDTFTITPTVDQDGSEHYTVTFDGTNLSQGTQYRVGANGTPQDASNGFTVTIPNNGGVPQMPEIYIMTPDNDSADIDNLKVTVSVTDSDTDSTGSITTNSKELTIDVDVDPVANDITLATTESKGDEDTLIDLNLNFTIDDILSVAGNETVTSVIIDAIPDGAKIYKADGTTLVYENSGGNPSATLTIGTNAGEYTQADIEGLKILPPGHSSQDFTLQVSAKTEDIDDGGGQATVTGSIAPVDVLVEVAPIAETNTDSNDDGNTDVTLNTDHAYNTHATEDTWFDLNTADSGFTLSTSNEDDKNNGSTHASEDTWVVFSDVKDGNGNALSGALIQYTVSGQTHTSSLNAEVEVPLDVLDTVKIKAPDNYAGTMTLTQTLRTLDHDEDNTSMTEGPTDSLTATLAINVDPAIDHTTISIAQSKGLEDAGRNADGTVDDSSAANGITLKALVKTLDTDGSEHLNAFLDKIPEDAAIYFDIDNDGTKELIKFTDAANGTYGTVSDLPDGWSGPDPIPVVQDNGDGTWKLLLENYDNVGQIGGRALPIIIAQHNSNEDIDLKVSGYSVDTVTFSDGTTKTVTGQVSSEYDIDIVIKGVPDDVVNNEMWLQDILVDIDSTTQDLTVTLDKSTSGKYSAVVEEDMGNTQVGAEINIKDIYKQPGLDSYDNLYTNNADQQVGQDTSAASETLSVAITGLADGFEVVGATYVGGTGTDRIWMITNAAEIQAGNIKITTPEHFSGEVDFEMRYVTTESDGATHTPIERQPVHVLVTPEAEGITTVLQASTDVREDTLTHMTFQTSTTAPDSDEYISALGIAKDDYDVNGEHFNGIDGADFTIYLGNTVDPSNTLQAIAADTGDQRVELVTENGVDFYKISDTADWKNLYVLYDADIGGQEDPNNVSPAHQTEFGFKFDVSDKTQAIQNGSTIDLIDTKSGFLNSANYTFTLSPVTDGITADAQDGDITDIDGDGTTDINVSGHDVTILAPTTINVAIQIDGIDKSGENGSGTNGENGLDADGSEQVRHIRVEGVPDGIGIVDGQFIGNVVGQPDTGIWLVDLQNPIAMDGTTQTYDLKFEVSGNYSKATASPSDIKISVIDQEYDTNGAEQATAQTGDFTLTFTRDTNFSGSTTDAPMDILDSNGDTIDEDGYSIDPNFAGFKEDTSATLGDIIHLDINDTQGGFNEEEKQTINSNLFSITVEGIDPSVVHTSAGGKPIETGTTDGWHIETVNGADILTYRGAGDKTAIENALAALVITPNQDRNHNNVNYIGQDDIVFTTTLTTYTQSGVKDVVSTDFSGNIEPVTDNVTVTPATANVDEDVRTTINLSLDTVDNSFGTDYATIVQNNNADPLTSIAFTYTGSSDIGNGEFGVTLFDKNNNPIHFSKGETHAVEIDLNANGGIDLDFIADSNESGTAHFTYEIFSKEDNAANVERSQASLDIDIAPIADGIDTHGGNAVAHGIEDEYIQLMDGSGNPLSADLIDNDTNNTTPETLETLLIGDVPNNWLIYYGSTKTLAQNLGSNANGDNTWNIPLSNGTIPEIYIKPPEQVGGVSGQFDLITGVVDGGQQIYAHTPIDVTVEAVADPLIFNPSPAGGIEGDEVALNFNSLSPDVDGSEKYEIHLTGLGEGAIFHFQGTELLNTAGQTLVNYDRGTDTYTISKDVGIDHATIDDLTVIQNDKSVDVTTKIVVHDGNDSWESLEKTFHIDITPRHATSGDDVLLYDSLGVDGLGGDDTVTFGTDWDGQNTINMTALKNIETLDLTEHGDHTLTLKTTDVAGMTDIRDGLTIETDSGDTVILANDGDDVWVHTATSNVYESAGGATLTINGNGTIDESVLTPTANDDILGYNGTEAIDAGAGIDTIILFENTTIDYTQLDNVEVLELKYGDHDLGTLRLNDVLDITDSNHTLTVEGEAGDTITLDVASGVPGDTNGTGDWDSVSSSGGYTIYTHTSSGASDPTVTLKVDDDIAVTVV